MGQEKQVRSPASREDRDQEENLATRTYGIVFGVCGEVAKHLITPRDAALMQSAEAHTLGQSQKGGAAAVMQCAADANEKAGKVNSDDQGRPTGESLDMAVTKTALTGQLLETEYVGGQAVRSNHKFTPTDHKIAASEAITIGQALQAIAMKAGEKPVEEGDARAIQSAVKRATGIATSKGCVAAIAQAAAVLNSCVDEDAETTLSDVLMNAPEKLPRDKVVTREDAKKVLEVERRANPNGPPTAGGVGVTLMAAAEINERIATVDPPEPHSYPAEDINEEVSRLDYSGEGGRLSESCIGYMEIAPLPGGEDIDVETHPKFLVVA